MQRADRQAEKTKIAGSPETPPIANKAAGGHAPPSARKTAPPAQNPTHPQKPVASKDALATPFTLHKAHHTEDDERHPQEVLFVAAAWACVVIGVVAVIFALYVARPVIVPLLAAFVVGIVVAPLSERIQRLGVRPLVANSILISLLFGLLGLGYFFASQRMSDVIIDLPRQMQTITDLLSNALAPLEQMQSAVNGGAKPEGAAAAIDVKAVALYVLSAFSPAVAQVLIFLFALILFSLDRAFLKRTLVMAFQDREARLDALRFINKLESDLSRYLSIAFVVNANVGLLTALALFLLGMPGYMLIGLAAFLLNFLPFVGPVALKVLLAVLGIAAFPTLVQGLLPVAAYAAIVLVESNAITPYLVGRQFSVRPLIVFIAIVFLTWLWGLAGALLALPLVVIASTLIQSFFTEETANLPG